jgi:hypothetical protein
MTTDVNLFSTSREVRLSLQARGLLVTKSFWNATQRILTSTLARFGRRIRAIHVWLDDVNGPRGGVDIRCRIDVELRPHGRISVSSLATDEYAATAKAAVRVRELVDRRVKKTRARRRRLVRA